MLKVENLSAWYGEAQALRGLNLQVEDGHLITLVGRNGAGKTTTLRSIIGLHRQIQGHITLDGKEISHWSADQRARAGLGYVQDDRGVYATLSVEENLLLPPTVGPQPWPMDRIYEMFPILKTRRRHSGAKLSGGEQQMLAIARALMTNPALMLLDEPFEGLAPVIVDELSAAMKLMLADRKIAIILVEQHTDIALELTAEAIVLERGAVAHRAPSGQLLKDTATLERLVGLRVAATA